MTGLGTRDPGPAKSLVGLSRIGRASSAVFWWNGGNGDKGGGLGGAMIMLFRVPDPWSRVLGEES